MSPILTPPPSPSPPPYLMLAPPSIAPNARPQWVNVDLGAGQVSVCARTLPPSPPNNLSYLSLPLQGRPGEGIDGLSK